MEILIAILAVVFVLGVTINIHEFGHFIVAKMLGMRVDTYSFFGFGPRIWGFKRGETDYRISAIPFGAYVAIAGESKSSLEEGEDAETVSEDRLYRSRPAWQRFLVMIGGPAMNILLALAIPFTMALMNGVPANPSPIVGFVKPQGAGETAGIKVGDRIVNFDGHENPTWKRMEADALLSPEKQIPIIVERNGQRLPLTITPTKIEVDGNTGGLLDFDFEKGVEPVVVKMVADEMPAAQAGIKVDDIVVSFNGKPVKNSDDLRNSIIQNGANTAKISVNRNEQPVELTVTPKVNDKGTAQIGVQFDKNLKTVREPVGLLGAASYAWDSNVEILRMTAKAFGQIGAGERSASESLQGPVGIARIIAQVANSLGWEGIFNIMALISLNLGIMNLLPIPALDGGRILLLGIEKVLSWFGKRMSEYWENAIITVSFGALLLLMLFATFNDVLRFFR